MMSSSGSDEDDLAERIRLNANLPRGMGMGMGAGGNMSTAMRTELDLVKQSMDRDRNLEEFGDGESIVDQSQFRNTQIGEGYQHSSVVRQRGLKGLEKEHKLSGPVTNMTCSAGSSSTHDLVKAKAMSSSKKKLKEKKHKHKHEKEKKRKGMRKNGSSDSDDSAGRKHRHKKKHKRDLERKEMMKIRPTPPSVMDEDVVTARYLEMARPALQRLRDKLELVQERRP